MFAAARKPSREGNESPEKARGGRHAGKPGALWRAMVLRLPGAASESDQAGLFVQRSATDGVSQPGDPLEREADRAADEAMRPGATAPVIRGATLPIMERKCERCDEKPPAAADARVPAQD